MQPEHQGPGRRAVVARGHDQLVPPLQAARAAACGRSCRPRSAGADPQPADGDGPAGTVVVGRRGGRSSARRGRPARRRPSTPWPEPSRPGRAPATAPPARLIGRATAKATTPPSPGSAEERVAVAPEHGAVDDDGAGADRSARLLASRARRRSSASSTSEAPERRGHEGQARAPCSPGRRPCRPGRAARGSRRCRRRGRRPMRRVERGVGVRVADVRAGHDRAVDEGARAVDPAERAAGREAWSPTRPRPSPGRGCGTRRPCRRRRRGRGRPVVQSIGAAPTSASGPPGLPALKTSGEVKARDHTISPVSRSMASRLSASGADGSS